jgi:hypothetical protein
LPGFVEFRDILIEELKDSSKDVIENVEGK